MAYNEITNRNSPNYTKGRGGNSIKSITIHWWGNPATNPSAEGVVNWLCNTASGVSAHFVATGTGRRVWQLVNDSDTAWHAGNWNGNQTSIGIECDPRCRDEDYDVVAELIKDLWRYYGQLPLVPHRDWTSTTCPGSVDLNRLEKLAEAKLNPPKPAPVPKPVPVTITKTQTFTPRTFKVDADTKLVNIPADTVYNSTVYKKDTTIDDVVELITSSNGKTFYRTKYARDISKKMYGFKGNVLTEVIPPKIVEPPVTPAPQLPVADKPDYAELNNTILKQILALLTDLITKFNNIFKG